jgi:osmoprotectant transport system substrate-binding protein
MKRPPVLGAVVGVLAMLALASCGSSSNPVGTSSASSATPSASSGGPIVVGSGNFQESVLLAQIYAGALRAKGVGVTTKLNIGSRETYILGLKDGSIDLIPEYSGVLLQYFDKTATAVGSPEVFAALQTKVPDPLTVLEQSQAQDKDAVVVTKKTAETYKLTSIADLAPIAGRLTFGGPPEFKIRPDGVPGLAKTYGVTFGTFKSLDAGGPLTVNALKNGQVDAADIFTTDPSIPTNGFVVLADPKNLYAAQNVLPLISKAKATPQVKAALNAVSAKLDTPTLTGLDKKVISDKQSPEVVAKAWLSSVGLA